MKKLAKKTFQEFIANPSVPTRTHCDMIMPKQKWKRVALQLSAFVPKVHTFPAMNHPYKHSSS